MIIAQWGSRKDEYTPEGDKFSHCFMYFDEGRVITHGSSKRRDGTNYTYENTVMEAKLCDDNDNNYNYGFKLTLTME